MQNPLAEVLWLLVGGVLIHLNNAFEALPHGVGREVLDVVLERVRHEPVFDPDPRFALMPEPAIFAQRLQHQVVEVFIMGKLNVAADVPSKAFLINEAFREAPDAGFFFKDDKVGDA